ncbi:MAG: type III secretion system chaperone [Candidatus Eiseniibacteriota bacterium]
MTTSAIGKLLDSYLTELEGEDGFWRGVREEVQIFVLSDDSHDRMRIMAPIGELKELEANVLKTLLEANYDRALDAKYALRGKEVWSVSVHPLATLAPDDFASFLEQVVRLVKNTGSSYASSDLVFGAAHSGDPDRGNGDDASRDDADDDRDEESRAQ